MALNMQFYARTCFSTTLPSLSWKAKTNLKFAPGKYSVRTILGKVLLRIVNYAAKFNACFQKNLTLMPDTEVTKIYKEERLGNARTAQPK